MGILFIDFQKAFDSVCHQTLRLKMQACGISGHLYLWLSDYLSDRKQFVQIDNAKSDLHNV